MTAMIAFIRKICFFIFSKIIPINLIERAIDNEKIKRQSHFCTIGDSSRLYKDTTISNLQLNKSKIVIGQVTHIQGELLIFAYGGEIIIGNHSYVGVNSRIWSGDKITIGHNVLISHNCNIVDTNAHEMNHIERAERYIELIKNGHPKTKTSIETKPITIEDYAWISFNVTILKGVTIGKGAIIAAGAVVTKDVDSFTMVAGNPAKFVKKLPH